MKIKALRKEFIPLRAPLTREKFINDMPEQRRAEAKKFVEGLSDDDMRWLVDTTSETAYQLYNEDIMATFINILDWHNGQKQPEGAPIHGGVIEWEGTPEATALKDAVSRLLGVLDCLLKSCNSDPYYKVLKSTISLYSDLLYYFEGHITPRETFNTMMFLKIDSFEKEVIEALKVLRTLGKGVKL